MNVNESVFYDILYNQVISNALRLGTYSIVIKWLDKIIFKFILLVYLQKEIIVIRFKFYFLLILLINDCVYSLCSRTYSKVFFEKIHLKSRLTINSQIFNYAGFERFVFNISTKTACVSIHICLCIEFSIFI